MEWDNWQSDGDSVHRALSRNRGVEHTGHRGGNGGYAFRDDRPAPECKALSAGEPAEEANSLDTVLGSPAKELSVQRLLTAIGLRVSPSFFCELVQKERELHQGDGLSPDALLIVNTRSTLPQRCIDNFLQASQKLKADISHTRWLQIGPWLNRICRF